MVQRWILAIIMVLAPIGLLRAEIHLKIPMGPEPPWVISKGNSFVGIDVETVKLMAKELGFTYEFIQCPWARCLKMMENGQTDFILGVFKRPEREVYMSFVEPGYLADDPKSFYVTKNSRISISSYIDLIGLNIGVVRGDAYFEPFDDDMRLRKVIVNSELQLLRMLEADRLDTFVGTPTSITYLINQNKLQGKFRRTIYQYQLPAYSYMAFSKKSKFLNQLDKFSATIRQLRDRNAFQKVVEAFLLKAPDNVTGLDSE